MSESDIGFDVSGGNSGSIFISSISKDGPFYGKLR